MTVTVAHLSSTLQTVFTTEAEQAARETGFIQRQRQLTGPAFVQALTFGWLDDPDASTQRLTELLADLGCSLTSQALDQRFTPQAADCLAAVLSAALDQVVQARPAAAPLLGRFQGVYLQDSTSLQLPDALRSVFPGCGGSTPDAGAAALKLQVRWELSRCTLEGLSWHSGRSADTKADLSRAFLPPGALRLTDLGYFDLDALQEYDQQEVYFLTRLPSRSVLYDASGKKWRLGAFLAAQRGDAIDVRVEVGAEKRLRCRLLAVRVPEPVAAQRRQRLHKQARKKGRPVSAERLALCAWTVYITNVPEQKLTLREALVLAGARWQIELVFKLWKSEGGLNRSRGQLPMRVLCEVFAKLLGMVVQHWLLLTAGPLLGRSLVQAARRVRRQALRLARALRSKRLLKQALRDLKQGLKKGCRIKKRRKKPATFQILFDPDLHQFVPQNN